MEENDIVPSEILSKSVRYHDKALELALQESQQNVDRIAHAMDAVDNKAMWVYGVSTTLLVVVPALADLPQGVGLVRILLGAAGVAWALTVALCFAVLRPRALKLVSQPSTFLASGWLELDANQYRAMRLFYLAKAADETLKIQRRKGAYLHAAAVAGFVEVSALGLALLSQL